MQGKIKWRGMKLSMLPVVLGIIILAGFIHPSAPFTDAHAEAPPTNLPSSTEQAPINASLNIYMPLVIFNAELSRTEQTIDSQATSTMPLFLSTDDNKEAHEIVASLNIYIPSYIFMAIDTPGSQIEVK